MSDFVSFLPWQQDQATSWLGQRERFAHAWLIHGLPGIGKRQFALAAAASLLCEAPVNGRACGDCAACLWLRSGSHPDLRRIRPEALAQEEGIVTATSDDTASSSATAKKQPSKEIKVEQLRVLHTWFNTATHRGGWRVAVLYPARAMNAITANALLKVLEEPPAHTVFLLVADAPDRLLPTLVSRCRRLPLAVPNKEASLQWLKEEGIEDAGPWLAAAGGAPLLARQLAQSGHSPYPEWLIQLLSGIIATPAPDIGPLADQLESQMPEIWIDALQRTFLDLLLASSGAPLRYFPSLGQQISAVAGRASPSRLAETAKWLAQQRAVAGHPLNTKLFAHSTLQRVVLACMPA
ncbi:DNA polymerase III subunit delta' [Pollutimonas harenae]|uniref:DNA polymerase III subunit delta n=1 Tax=Pollutimonas harenae TaxID=657015 RepID=A0A853GSG4_9BURK|nr:DNA polymerase III subunit delta' [Pollutimonas harenae]NYT86048.1 DNA polymerase III subunit delta' [Pollutimonas harenae]TEA71096.1 DNA polymerase III subunit delta' [Pollutimonas harenae]